jgi:hypothetical protein
MRLQQFLERKGEKAHRDAVAMGLQYKGFGYWADPQTGEAKYKTVNDQLVPVEGDVESELYKGDGEDEGPTKSGAGGQMAVPGGAAAGAPVAPPVGSGENIGPAMGQAQRPTEKKGWEAGPDGDTCVDGQPTEELPQDMFVGKTNSARWTAGPDGDNAMELGEMRQWISEAEFNRDRKQHIKNVRDFADGNNSNPGTETKNDVMFAQGRGSAWLKSYLKRVANNAGVTPPTSSSSTEDDQGLGSDFVPLNTQQKADRAKRLNKNNKDKQRKAPAKKIADDLFDKGIEPEFPLDRQIIRALNARRKKDTQSPGAYQRGLKWMKDQDLAGGTGSNEYRDSDGKINQDSRYDSYPYDDDSPEPPSWLGGGTPKVQDTDEENVLGLNASARELVQDADFDLDQYDDRSPLASGAFGSFTLGDDGVGVKTGNIGPGELAALYAMKDNPHFPTLINARFDGPFINQSAAYNNPGDNSNMRRGADGNYFDPKTAQTWDKRFPGAWGKYAMSVAGGEQLASVWNDLTPDIQEKALKSFWEARGELHKAGFSHNDMHGGNIMVDPETGEVSILDLGLADDNPTSALMEALGGLDFEEGNDYQLAHQVSGSNLPQEIMDRITERRSAFEERIMDSFEGDMDDEEGYDNALSVLSSVMGGNIRMDREELEKITSVFPNLGDGDFVKERLAELYDGLWDTEYPEDAAREEPTPGGLMGNRSRVDSLINRMRGKGQIGTGASGKIRKAMGIDPDD